MTNFYPQLGIFLTTITINTKMFVIIFASILISIIFAQLGCMSLWRRYTYFTDGFAHASVLASIIGLATNIPLIYAGILFSTIFAIAIFKYRRDFDGNVAVSIISNFALSIAVILSYWSNKQVNINKLLFGDILSVLWYDVVILLLILAAVTVFFLVFYKQIILLIINQDIAKTRGVNTTLIELIFLILLSVSVFIGTQITGALLVAGMLLIPAMIVERFATTPSNMIILTIFVAIALAILGLVVSFYVDNMPIAPVIISTGSIIYFIVCMIRK